MTPAPQKKKLNEKQRTEKEKYQRGQGNLNSRERGKDQAPMQTVAINKPAREGGFGRSPQQAWGGQILQKWLT
jgi:hypothetical protein